MEKGSEKQNETEVEQQSEGDDLRGGGGVHVGIVGNGGKERSGGVLEEIETPQLREKMEEEINNIHEGNHGEHHQRREPGGAFSCHDCKKKKKKKKSKKKSSIGRELRNAQS